MHYSENFYSNQFDGGINSYKYVGTKIPLYGLSDTLVDYYFLLIANVDFPEYCSTKGAVGLQISVDLKLRKIAEKKEGREILRDFTLYGSNAHFACNGHIRYVPDWYVNPDSPVSKFRNLSRGIARIEYSNVALTKIGILERFGGKKNIYTKNAINDFIREMGNAFLSFVPGGSKYKFPPPEGPKMMPNL